MTCSIYQDHLFFFVKQIYLLPFLSPNHASKALRIFFASESNFAIYDLKELFQINKRAEIVGMTVL